MSTSLLTKPRWLLLATVLAAAIIAHVTLRDPVAVLASDLGVDLPHVLDDNTQMVAVLALDNRLEFQIQRSDVRATDLTPEKFSELMQQLVPIACSYVKRHEVIDSGVRVQYRMLTADRQQLPAFDIALTACNLHSAENKDQSAIVQKQ